MTSPRFAPAEDALILYGPDLGMDDRQIADHLFLAVHLVGERRAELLRPLPVPRKPRTIKPSRPYQVWSPSQDQTLRRLVSGGLTYRQVADQMGRVKNSVQSRVRRLAGTKK